MFLLKPQASRRRARAVQSAAGDRPGAVPAAHRDPGRARVRHQPAEPGRRLLLVPGRVRAAGRQDYESSGKRCGRHDGRGAEARLPHQPGHRSPAQQAAARHRRSIASGRRSSACRSPTSARRWRRSWAGAWSPSSSAATKQYDVIVQMRPTGARHPGTIEEPLPARPERRSSSWRTSSACRRRSRRRS